METMQIKLVYVPYKLHVLAYQQKLRKSLNTLLFSLFRSYATIPAVDQELIFTLQS